MVTGILEVELGIAGSNSLKDKRQVIKSLLAHIRNRFNVSAAETGRLNIWRRAGIGVACVSNDQKIANTVLNNVLEYIESDPRVSVDSVNMEFL
ncbi:MAG TPA: DUF503 domain-containing protein [Armatimonadetes bacterium]|jgi:uncharacterized protein YlxP (DUF503 family)|nr:DUF503 domain-containing protein [Armatimonadota bacterium]